MCAVGTVVYLTNKKEGIFETEKACPVSCYVCPECGYIELNADNSKKLISGAVEKNNMTEKKGYYNKGKKEFRYCVPLYRFCPVMGDTVAKLFFSVHKY